MKRIGLLLLVVMLVLGGCQPAQSIEELASRGPSRITSVLANQLQVLGATQLLGTVAIGNNTTVTGDITVSDDVVVSDDLTVVGGITVNEGVQSTGDLSSGGSVTSVGRTIVGTMLQLTPATAITATNGFTLTPVSTYQPLVAAGNVGFSAITAGTAGTMLILTNNSNTTITITDTATTMLSGNIALAQYDTLMLVSDGTNWRQYATTNN